MGDKIIKLEKLHSERLKLQHDTVVDAVESLLSVSHKSIPIGARVCRVTVVLHAQNAPMSIDFEPMHTMFVKESIDE